MARVSLELTVRVAWWVRWYLAGVLLVARLAGLEPNWIKVLAAVERGIRMDVTP